MTGLIACFLAFVVTLWSGRRSLGQGLIALLGVGYAYGIVRANLLTPWSHFTFDAALLGLYLSQKWTSSDPVERKRFAIVQLWIAVLIGWSVLIALLPFQPLLVSIVGLRGNVFFIPIVLLGIQLKHQDLLRLTGGLAVLNIIVLGFAAGEYVLGVPRFYPMSPVTQIIYGSILDGGEGFFRIPATFANAHAYGGAMVCSLPFLIGGWDRPRKPIWRLLVLAGIGAALLGILLSATRVNFVYGVAMIAVTILTSRLSTRTRLVFMLLVAVLGVVAMSNVRFQRFKTLGDTDLVTDRVAGSVNRGFFEILVEHPMGNGLGGGGTSIPYFLQGEVRNPIGMENEYARILGEQGVIGLLLWLSFVIWFLSRAKVAFGAGQWVNGRRMAWSLAAVLLATAWLGVGLLTAIPQTVLMLLGMGWSVVPEMAEPTSRPVKRVPIRAHGYRSAYVPAVR
jgi:hypothetical protein